MGKVQRQASAFRLPARGAGEIWSELRSTRAEATSLNAAERAPPSCIGWECGCWTCPSAVHTARGAGLHGVERPEASPVPAGTRRNRAPGFQPLHVEVSVPALQG